MLCAVRAGVELEPAIPSFERHGLDLGGKYLERVLWPGTRLVIQHLVVLLLDAGVDVIFVRALVNAAMRLTREILLISALNPPSSPPSG